MLEFTRFCVNKSPAYTIALTHEDRVRSRILHQHPNGVTIGIRLPRGTRLPLNSLLESESGEVLRIEGAAEQLSFVDAEGFDLARVCYHLGNRHVVAMLNPSYVAYPTDLVLDDLVRTLGFEVRHEWAVFNPEPGAYDAHHGH